MNRRGFFKAIGALAAVVVTAKVAGLPLPALPVTTIGGRDRVWEEDWLEEVDEDATAFILGLPVVDYRGRILKYRDLEDRTYNVGAFATIKVGDNLQAAYVI
jgi:hypothetical protein